MDQTFLWCATSVVAKLALKDIYGNSTSSHIVDITKTSVHENIYEYDVDVDSDEYDFKYTFESNTFVKGTLDIQKNHETFKSLRIEKDMKGFKVYMSDTDYIEFYIFNHKQLIGIRVKNNQKTSVTSVTISEEKCNKDNIEYILNMTSAAPSLIDDEDIRLRMILFAVNGVSNKKYHHCQDVVAFKTKNVSLIIFSDVVGQVICTDCALNKVKNEQVGTVTVINSDFNQKYEYVYDTKKNIYFIEEIVKAFDNDAYIKEKFFYKEQKGIACINDQKKYSIVIDDNDIIFEEI